MTEQNEPAHKEISMNNGRSIPALGFGTLIPDLADTLRATKSALQAGFRQFDCSERYRNEQAVGEAIQAVLQEGKVRRDDLFIATKLWNNNHRPERVKPAFEASLARLRLDYVDLYLMHTPFAFRPGDDQDPQDENGKTLYDDGVTLSETWAAMERLVDEGKCRAIGLSDVDLAQVTEINRSARIRPAVVHVEAHPYLPQWELLEACKQGGMVFQAFAVLGHSFEPRLLEDEVIKKIAAAVGKTAAQVCIAWALQRGTAILTTSTNPDHIRESLDVSPLPEGAMEAIKGITTRYRFNKVVETGLPGFIPREADRKRAAAE
ncbi:MAG TPA: aldo/keto reductase [Candidatus Sulfotelmatobacter sp.]|nr:aldo/keto reductase [Candidatus Sulfotelmatobacter sp.]